MRTSQLCMSGKRIGRPQSRRIFQALAVAATWAIVAIAPGQSSYPRLALQIGGACDVSAIHGDLLLAGEGSNLRLFDIADPAAPKPLGSVRLPTRPLAVQAMGNRVYMACGAAGLQVADVGDVSLPLLVGSYQPPGQEVMGIVVEEMPAVGDGKVFAIVGGTAGVPAALHVLRFEDVPMAMSPARRLRAAGDLPRPEDNVVTMTQPVLVGRYIGLSDPRDVALQGDTVFVANGDAGLELLHVEDRTITDTLVARIGSFQTTAPALGVASLSAQGIIIINNLEGLEFVNVSDPMKPMSKGVYAMGGGAGDATAYGTDMVLAAGDMGVDLLIVQDIPGADLEHKYIGTVPTQQQAAALMADPANGLLAVAQHGLGFELFDLGDIANPQRLYHHLLLGNPRGIGYSMGQRGIIIVNNRGWADAFSVPTPFTPMLVRTFELGEEPMMSPDPQSVALTDDDLLLVADAQKGLILFNAVKWMAPTYQSTFPTRGAAADVFVMGNLAYVAENGSAILEIVDISKPSSPTLVGTYEGAGEGHAVFVDGDYAYLAAGEGGLQVVDVSNPAMPSSDIAHKVVPPDEAFDVYVANGLAYLAVGPGGVLVLDMFDPTGGFFRARHETPASALSVLVNKGMVFVGTEGGGGVVFGAESAVAEQDSFFEVDGNVGALFPVGDAVYALTEDDGMWVYDFRTATRPVWDRY